MNAFPKELPLPLRSGYGFEPSNNIIRTDMESGRARQRIAFTKVPTSNNLSWIFDPSQALLFEAWAVQVAKAQWFTMKLKTPLGLLEYEARFTESPAGPVLVGQDGWQYSARVELKERPMLEDGWVEYLPEYILLADIFDLAVNREWPAGS
ncbi:hypothetical protein [Pseudomonas fluorescens]|uniref:Uncharacterized protein n=1 Tax=Pseudomonas fluorescens TaxID=294 RepID=A0A5E7BF37_PSEFL|nr:hypothetical protein [Pseudomonas fluorescens]VVN83753.1 hypothetical protein PS704_01304 [Pseudomonas fluorescens]